MYLIKQVTEQVSREYVFLKCFFKSGTIFTELEIKHKCFKRSKNKQCILAPTSGDLHDCNIPNSEFFMFAASVPFILTATVLNTADDQGIT